VYDLVAVGAYQFALAGVNNKIHGLKGDCAEEYLLTYYAGSAAKKQAPPANTLNC